MSGGLAAADFRYGRASRLGERTLGHPGPGCGFVFDYVTGFPGERRARLRMID